MEGDEERRGALSFGIVKLVKLGELVEIRQVR